MYTPESIRSRFRKYAIEIWGDFVSKVEVEVRIVKGQKAPGRLLTPGTQKIIGHSLYQCPRKVTLEISDKALKLSPEKFEMVLRHEVLHIGVTNHGKTFQELAKIHGVKVSMMDIHDQKVHLQIKEGARYKTIKVFDTPKEAEKYYKNVFHPANPGVRGRIQF